MLAKEPVWIAECGKCFDVLEIPLVKKEDGLWYDGEVDTFLEEEGWKFTDYERGVVVCGGCHEARRQEIETEDIIRENRVEMPRGYSFGQVGFY